MRRILLATFFRILPPLLCVMVTMIAFEEGVNTSNMDIPNDAPFMHLYYALGLFALAGIDLGMPLGGPVTWRIGLWMVYFAAPLLTVAAIIDGVVSTFRPYIPGLWPRRNHLIIAGAGRVSRAFLRELRQQHPNVPVVLVDRNPETELVVQQRNVVLRDRRVWTHVGDLYDEALLDQLYVSRAKGILLLTGDEVANIEAASHIYEYFSAHQISPPPMRIRMDDLHLMKFANQRFGTHNRTPCINIHYDAAVRICRTTLERMQETTGMDVLIFIGFGRFSQTFLLEFIENMGCDEIHQIKVLDPRAGFCWAEFLSKVDETLRNKLEHVNCDLIEGGVRDPRNIAKLSVSNDPTGGQSVVLLGTSHDQLNLRAAMRIRAHLHEAFILVRLFDVQHFAQRVADSQNLTLISTSSEMQDSMQGWIDEML